MRSILTAVDGSDAALRGVTFAAEMAMKMDARLDVVHVSPPTLLPSQVYADVIAQLQETEHKYSEQVLHQAAEAARAAQPGLQVDQIALTGAVAEAIADLAEQQNVWMVVVGSHGHKALSRVLLGSCADRLVHICKRPVLVVR